MDKVCSDLTGPGLAWHLALHLRRPNCCKRSCLLVWVSCHVTHQYETQALDCGLQPLLALALLARVS